MDETLGAPNTEASAELRSAGPPWILGQRGAPLEAPENTLASLRCALAAGLDGFAIDVHACAGDDPVVIADPRLERTTDGQGAVSERSLPELFALDAGGWFSKRFSGAGIPHLDDALELELEDGGEPLRIVHVHDERLLPELARRAHELERETTLMCVTRRRELCLAMRDEGLRAGLLVVDATEEDLAWARDARISFMLDEATETWLHAAAEGAWPCERWVAGLDDPEGMLQTMRTGVNGFTTSEPRRALAVRTLVGICDCPSYPLEVPPLIVSNDADPEGGGEWSGRWEPSVFVHNPFEHEVRVACRVVVRRGAFEVEGLPKALRLAPGEVERVVFRLRGGSWSPGGDPLFAALYDWDRQGERAAGRLLLDAPLRRERRVVASGITQRLEMLRESPGQERATMTLCRRGRQLALHIENPGGLVGARALVHLAGRTWSAARSLRVNLPEGFDDLLHGMPFSCGFSGHAPSGGPEVLRRWAGGLPAAGENGVAGRLLAR